jgi:hypothetical protein
MNAHPTDIVDNTVALLQSFSTLVADELAGDIGRVFAHADAFPGDNLETAILNAPHPSIMVAYMGAIRGEWAKNEVLRHKVCLYIRPREAAVNVSGARNIIYQIENGLDNEGLTFRNSVIHEECHPIGRDLEFKRIMTLANDIDIWEATFLLTEVSG